MRPLPLKLYYETQTRAQHLRNGTIMRLMMNGNGVLGSYAWGDSIAVLNDVWGLTYPPNMEHLREAGLMVGARIWKDGRWQHRVSCVTGSEYDLARDTVYSYFETIADTSRGDTIFTTGINITNEPNRRGFDDDGDGRIDEDDLDGTDNDGDWLINRDDLNHNGKPDHGEPNVDEDYGAVSESDVYISYRDSFAEPRIDRHFPLSIKIRCKSYAWTDLVKEPILILEYQVINEWIRSLDSVYLGMIVLTDLTDRNFDIPETWRSTTFSYLPEVRTWATNTFSTRGTPTPLGITFLNSSIPLDQTKLTFHPLARGEPEPQNDELKYALISSGIIDQSGSTVFQGFVLYLGVGPFPTMEWHDTARFTIAFVSGDAVEHTPNSIRVNAAKAIELYNRGFQPPVVPPSPPLKLGADSSGIRLDWSWDPSSPRSNPEEAWDDSNKIINALPDTHWRRRNPPAGKSGGGRIFEEFRIWRSDYPVYDEKQFSLIKQFDVKDDLDLEGQTGIVHSYVDSSVVRGKRYWYAVTSRSVPDYFLTPRMSVSGQIVGVDTILTEPKDSPLFQNATTSAVPFTPSNRVGDVKVVPNPYRTDRNYIYEQGGWEGLGRLWIEDRRVIWFIHLPAKCTIRIFSLAGEVIKTISHDDNDRQSRNLAVGQEEFELLSESNRALASGIYIYPVESEFGTQTGKFVVIR